MSIDFIEQLESDIIPRIIKLIEKEEIHLEYLKQNKNTEQMINVSERYLKHYHQRLEEYRKYVYERKN